MKKFLAVLFILSIPVLTVAGVWQTQAKLVRDFWVGPFPTVGSGTILTFAAEQDANIYYVTMNGNEPSKSIYPAVMAAIANGNPIYPSVKSCFPKDGFTWCEIDGIHLGK